MSYEFLTRSLHQGLYEPEGIYLTSPLNNECRVIQAWGEHSTFYGSFRYNGVPMKGHNGVDFEVTDTTHVVAVDDGRVMEIGLDREGYGRYIKINHNWGESFYANLGELVVDTGQIVTRGVHFGMTKASQHSFLHFGIRIRPYNRFDGWGGFVDPIPFLDPANLVFGHAELDPEQKEYRKPHSMMIEDAQTRRP